MWLLLHRWKQQRKQILGFCWLGQWVLIIRSFHSRWKSIHGSGPSHSGHQYITEHTPFISTRGNLEPICAMQTVGIQSIQMRHPHRDSSQNKSIMDSFTCYLFQCLWCKCKCVLSEQCLCIYQKYSNQAVALTWTKPSTAISHHTA